MPRKKAALVAGVFALTALGASTLVLAKPQSRAARAAEVIAGDALCTRTAPNGKAWITHLAQGENAYLGRLELVAFGKVPEHRDPTEEYIHVLQGHGTLTIDGVKHKIGPGSTVYMPANALVSYENGPENLVAIQVFAGPSPAKKYAAWKGCE